jgi:hypothetical protein
MRLRLRNRTQGQLGGAIMAGTSQCLQDEANDVELICSFFSIEGAISRYGGAISKDVCGETNGLRIQRGSLACGIAGMQADEHDDSFAESFMSSDFTQPCECSARLGSLQVSGSASTENNPPELLFLAEVDDMVLHPDTLLHNASAEESVLWEVVTRSSDWYQSSMLDQAWNCEIVDQEATNMLL